MIFFFFFWCCGVPGVWGSARLPGPMETRQSHGAGKSVLLHVPVAFRGGHCKNGELNPEPQLGAGDASPPSYPPGGLSSDILILLCFIFQYINYLTWDLSSCDNVFTLRYMSWIFILDNRSRADHFLVVRRADNWLRFTMWAFLSILLLYNWLWVRYFSSNFWLLITTSLYLDLVQCEPIW